VTAAQRTRSLVVALVLLSIAGAALAHYAIALGHSPTLGALLALVPVAAIAAVSVRRSGHRATVLLAIAAIAFLAWAGWDTLERQFQNLFFVEHVGTNLILGAVFGRTLAARREPLCTRFARLLHGPLCPEEIRYSRQVTVAWTVFFLVIATLSCALYFSGHIAAWSILANFLTLPLVAAMFVIEYAIRLRVVPNVARAGILGSVRAFWVHAGGASSEAPH
jgi:uncharacterized membrane protein